MIAFLKDLTVETIQAPREAAERLLALRLERSTLWLGLALAAVLNTLMFMSSMALFPMATPLPVLFASPFLYAAVMAGGLVMMALILAGLGRAMGGTGTLDGILTLLVWLQLLRLAVQVVLLVLTMLVPFLAAPITIAVALIGFWIFLHFLDVVHEFHSLMRALVLLILAVLGIAFGLSILLALLGVTTMGVV